MASRPAGFEKVAQCTADFTESREECALSDRCCLGAGSGKARIPPSLLIRAARFRPFDPAQITGLRVGVGTGREHPADSHF